MIAKISTPRLFGVVARERLFARLDENRGRPLIWIEGPPGAGKTTLVASYLEARGIPVLWYQVDPGDADPANLFHYLALAVAFSAGAEVPAPPKLVAEHLSDLPAFGRTFFRELFSRMPAGIVVVLDNYQEIDAGAVMQDIIRTAVAEVPPGCSILCISRSDAPGPFAQLTAQGSVFHLRWDALKLTLDETRAISAGRDVRDDWLVQALHKQSEGWAAGVTLMLERLGTVDTSSKEMPGSAHESVFDYFASLIFEHAPASIQATLLSVAFLPDMTASTAMDLSGNEHAEEILEGLYRRRLFTDRRQGVVPVYQFHALFRGFLRDRVNATIDESEVRRHMGRSAEALEKQGNIEGAVDLRFAARDWDAAARLVAEIAGEFLNCGRRHTIERWILSLPSDVVDAHPWLTYWLGMAFMQTSPAGGVEMLRVALGRFRSIDESQGQFLCLSGLLNGAFLGYSAVEAMDEWLDELLAMLGERHSFSTADVELRVWGVLCSALFWVRPSHPWTTLAVQHVESLLPRARDPNVALAAASSALATATLSGDFERGDRIAVATAHLVDLSGASPSEAAWWLVRAGYLDFLQARYENALSTIRRACAIADANGMRAMFETTIYHRYMVEFRVSGWTVANATMAEMELMPKPSYPVGEAMFHVYQARRAHSRGLHEMAADLADQAHAAIHRAGSQYQHVLFGLVDAELFLTAMRTAQGRVLLARSRDIIQRSPALDCWRAALVFCEAFLAHTEGDRDVSVAALRDALTLAKAGNRKFFLRYLDCCMPPLFSLALEERIEVDLVQQLIRMFRLEAPADAPDLWPRFVRIQTFGRFEVRIKDEPLEFSRKVPKKTLALLKALIAHGAEEVPEQWLCDSLWGDEEADAARQVLGVTVLRLRKLLGNDEAIGQQGGKVWLDRQLCWVDAWRFENLSGKSRDPEAVRDALNLYAGAFLSEDEGESWSVPMRERLRGKFIHALATCGEALETEGDVDEAIRLYLRGIDADVIVEAFHRGLMRCYRRTGRMTEAVSAYRRLRQTMSVVLGVSPSAESEALYRELIAELATEPVEAQAAAAEAPARPPKLRLARTVVPRER